VLRFLRSLFSRDGKLEEPLLDVEELALWYEALSPVDQRLFTNQIARQVRGSRDKKGKNLRSTAIGKLAFEVEGPGGPVPMHNFKVELWDRDPGSPDDFLGEGYTDDDGAFLIKYDPDDAGAFDLPDLELRVFEPHHKFSRDGTVRNRWRRIWSERGADDFEGELYDFQCVRIPYWEYDPEWPIPRVLITEEGQAPTSYAPGRNLAMLKAVNPIELIKRRHLSKAVDDHLSLAVIQKDYPTTLTIETEKKDPGSTRSDRWFGERFMKGMLAGTLDGDPDVPGQYRVYFHWNSYEHDGVHALPNVDIRFALRDDALVPVRILLGLREPGASAANSPVTKYDLTPADAEWEPAKRLARISATLDTELGSHLAQCHLNAEQYVLASHRNLRMSPLRYLLFPHLREVVLINASANNFLIGPTGYITRACALTSDGINERIVQLMGTFDWKGYHPAPPISDKHHYAMAANLFWDVVTEFVAAYFEENEAAFKKHWIEVRRFSDDVVAHSAPFFACKHLRTHVMGKDADWFQRTERTDLESKRAVFDGVERAVTPITTTDTPAEGDMENLQQLCRYIIFLTTFRHAWANNKQWEDGGEVMYSCLGLRWGDNGVLVPEDDLSVAPGPRHATEMLWISYMLSKTQYGFLLRNEEEDLHPGLVDRLRTKVAEFAELDLDLDTVSSRINI
jgi:hypothetical protein